MRYLKYITRYLVFLTLCLSGCEKDDICAEATPTTPTLILRFYDFGDQDQTKNVTGLRATGIDDNDEEVPISSLASVNSDSIAIPLRTDADNTRFTFYLDYAINDNGTPEDESDDFTTGNPDTVTISYQREEVYVSRACGFKTIFKDIIFNVDNDGDRWIINSEIINATVDNELSAHIKILH
jgi:hypothetical protein